MCEVESIVNSRPLTTVSGDPKDLDPLTPNHILLGRAQVSLSSPGIFQKSVVYLRRRWRRETKGTNVFCRRRRKEYLSILQSRQRFNKPTRNLQIGDVVVVKDDSLPRGSWPLARVVETESDKKGFVRAVKVKTQSTLLRRPVNKLVLIVPS